MSDPQRDFLAYAVSGTSGNPVLAEIRSEGADAVLAVYRFVKNALLHAVDNQAVIRAADQAQRVLVDLSAAIGGNVSITYTEDTVFVCGQLLRASRSTYEAAMELGALLGRGGVSEVSFDPTITSSALLQLAAALAAQVRDASRRGGLASAVLPGITLRGVDPALEPRHDDRDAPVRDRAVRLYATALVVMRRFFDNLAAGTTLLPHRVKRVAQSLVTLFETGEGMLLAMTAPANAHRDDAGRVVQAAIVAVAVARQITRDRVTLSRIAMAALMADVGRVRLAGTAGRDQPGALPEDVDAQVPQSTSSICIATGGVNLPNAIRTVTAYETTWIERAERLGPLYGRSSEPLLQARILYVVRALLDRMAPRDASPARSPLDALADLTRQRATDPAVFRLLVRALGALPLGTVVELDTGEWAVVVGPSTTEQALDRPRVRIVTDARGRGLNVLREVDLGAQPNGAARVARIVEPEAAAFNVVGALLAPVP